MYCSLGDIKFDVLLGLSKFDDSREMTYAQMSKIGRKSTLQQTGEKPYEINTSITFKTAFCTPEDEYNKLEKKRQTGEVLTFIWGSGEIEGDFVITSSKKTIEELGANGQWDSITCDITLLESYSGNKISASQQRIEKAAFATTLDTPRPSNIQVTEPSAATDVMDDVQDVNIQSTQVADGLDNAAVQAATKTGVINQAQEFVDNVNADSYQLSKLTTQTIDLLNDVNIKVAASSNVQTIAPLLNAQISYTTTVMNSAQTIINGYSSLPNPVTTLVQANTVLTVMANTIQAVKDVKQAIIDLKKAAQPLAVAIATRKNV